MKRRDFIVGLGMTGMGLRSVQAQQPIMPMVGVGDGPTPELDRSIQSPSRHGREALLAVQGQAPSPS